MGKQTLFKSLIQQNGQKKNVTECQFFSVKIKCTTKKLSGVYSKKLNLQTRRINSKFLQDMSKAITISLQNLNSLYFKFINQFVLQYLPKDVYNDVVNLLSLKSAVQTYRCLDKLLTQTQDKKALSFAQDKQGFNLVQEQKNKHMIQEKKENQKRSESYQQRSNASNQGSASYVDKDEFKYQNDLNTIKKPPTLLKRTQTYQSPEKPSHINYESYNFGQARLSKQEPKSKQVLPNAKSPSNNLNQTTSINVVKHDFDTVSEKHTSLGMVNNKRESKDGDEIRSNFNTVGDGYSLKGNTRDSKQKSDQNLSTKGHKKTEFSKTYSTRQPQLKILTSSANAINSNLSSTQGNNYQSSTSSIVNRSRFQNLIRQTKEIFNENAKKIARYEKISTDVGQKPQKSSNDSSSPFSPQSGNSYTYMYKKY